MNDKRLPPDGDSLADDLMIGASTIAVYVHGRDDPDAVRDIYRNAANLPVFKYGPYVAAFKSSIRKRLRQAEQEGRMGQGLSGPEAGEAA
jgi:hypothetical protein